MRVTPMTKRSILFALGASVIASLGCSATEPGPGDCEGDNCDTPGITDQTCKDRRSDAIESAQRAYVPGAIRWSCADVEGVNTNGTDDRGQEYCEYYAIVKPPGSEAKPAVLGKIVGQNTAGPIVNELSIKLTDDQIAAIEDAPNAVVGQCVFHSWHSDIDMGVPACSGASCPDIMGFRLDAVEKISVGKQSFSVPMFQMMLSVNSNSAAQLLSRDCLKGGTSSIKDDFTRGCELCTNLFDQGLCVPWRKSDPTICSGVMRLAECGCSVTGGNVPAALVPTTRRGFPLGTWSGPKELPSGCRYVDPGDGSQTIVSCDLTASDLLASATDPKGLCRSKYADNVVVHIPIPPKAVTCKPPAGAKCTATPWVITP